MVSISLLLLFFIVYIIQNQHTEKNTNNLQVQKTKRLHKENKDKPQDHYKQLAETSKTPKQSYTKPFRAKSQVNIVKNDISTQNFNELKINALKTIHEKSIEAIKKVPECLENAKSKEEAFSCSKELRKHQGELAIALGDFETKIPQKYDATFVWDEKTKTDMINNIESSMDTMEETQDCIEASSTSKELTECFKR